MDYKRLFYNWLKKEKIYHTFFCNVILHNECTHKFHSGKQMFEYIIKIINKDSKNYVSAFIWENTFQGYEYWVAKHKEWKDYLSQWIQTH